MRREASATVETYVRQEWGFKADDDQDTKAIAELILRWAVPGNWLDLGCGPMLTVWPLFHPGPFAVFGIDRNPEIGEFHARLAGGDHVRPEELCEAQAYADTYLSDRGIERMPLAPAQLHIGSVVEPVQQWIGKIHTVVQIGCFGCLGSLGELRKAAQRVHDYLVPGGTFISATWTPREGHFESRTWGGDGLRELDRYALAKCLTDAGLQVLQSEAVELACANYRERFTLVATRPPTAR